MKSEGKTRASSGPIIAELTYLEGLQHSIHVYFIAIRNRLITSSVPVYLQPSLSPEQHFKTGSPCGPLSMRNACRWRTSARVFDHKGRVLFWKPVAESFHMQPRINTFPTCSVHPSLPSLGYLHTIYCPSHTGTPCGWLCT